MTSISRDFQSNRYDGISAQSARNHILTVH